MLLTKQTPLLIQYFIVLVTYLIPEDPALPLTLL